MRCNGAAATRTIVPIRAPGRVQAGSRSDACHTLKLKVIIVDAAIPLRYLRMEFIIIHGARMTSLALVALMACTPTGADTAVPDDSADTGSGQPVDGRYAFLGRNGDPDSVAYEGQVFRHLLIADMKSQLSGVTARIDAGWFPEPGDLRAELDFYLRFDSETSGTVELLFAADPPPAQVTYDDVASGKDLAGKIAGNDPEGQHVAWAEAFRGWEDPAVTSPESLVDLWFDELDAAAVDRANGRIPLDPAGAPIAAVHLTEDGRDLQQLLQKFLLASVAFSQGTDDYLDDDLDGAGLRSDHAALVDGKPYTELEHAWDEAFGYFGASRDYCGGSDATTADPGYADTVSADGSIDLLTEVCWGHSTNAAKRDLGAVSATDLSADAWQAFLAGRTLLARTDAPLTDTELAELRTYRDQAVTAWESAIAASVVHYLNGVLRHMDTFGAEAYDFDAHAKEWSEMKGFALSFQFNPRSPLSDAAFEALHAQLGQAPVLPDASEQERTAYREALLAARASVGAAYGFDAANLGGQDGTGGW